MRVLIVAVVLFVLVSIALMFVPVEEGVQMSDAVVVGEPIGQIGDFSFIDESGAEFSSETLKGKVWLAGFVFTSCTAECPILSQRVAEVRQNLKGHDDAAFVSFSVDPGTDSPERLAKYAEPYGQDYRWKLLTGDPDKLDTLIKHDFLLPVAADFHERSDIAAAGFIHSNKLIVVDQSGQIRYVTDGMEEGAADKITQAMEILLH